MVAQPFISLCPWISLNKDDYLEKLLINSNRNNNNRLKTMEGVLMDFEEADILLVEDNPTDAELTMRALKRKNLANQVVWVKDGAEALEFIFATGQFAHRDVENFPKLILLDLRMPKVDGLEVLQKIKADERTNRIPVVVLTSSQEDRDIVESYKLGVNSYVSKPVEFDDFIEAVSTLGFYWMLINNPPNSLE
jgi:two-component system, response regulator